MAVYIAGKEFMIKRFSLFRPAAKIQSCGPDTVVPFPRRYYYLIGALLVAFLVRVPGVFWGWNFPTGWYGHHVDEYTHLVNAETLINPKLRPRWNPHPYPKGMAAHVAVPLIGARLIEGKLFDKPPTPRTIITLGRVINVLYGTATILIVFLLARRLFTDPRVAVFAAWILALGGLHVSQSHYFLSDVPAIFWYLLGTYLLLLDATSESKKNSIIWIFAAFCLGVALGLKLFVFILPSLTLAALYSKPRLTRCVQGMMSLFVGFVVVNFVSYTPYDIAKTLSKSVLPSYEISWWSNLVLYSLELPSVVSFPITLFFFGGAWLLLARFRRWTGKEWLWPIIVVVGMPVVFYGVLVVFRIAHFPRHLVLFIPWISIIAGWCLVQTIYRLRSNGLPAGLVVIPLFVYLAVFVFDGERVFLAEPRNEAARWLLENVEAGTQIHWLGHGRMPGFKHVVFPDDRPPVVVVEMHRANPYLSGQGLKNSYPTNYRVVFDGRSSERLRIFQSLFRGDSEYKEVALFKEGYFMPEYTIVDNLIGNRSRNYVAEVVIFMHRDEVQQTGVHRHNASP